MVDAADPAGRLPRNPALRRLPGQPGHGAQRPHRAAGAAAAALSQPAV